MQLCWEFDDWANFKYDKDLFWSYRDKFFKNVGLFIGSFDSMSVQEQSELKINILLDEAMASSQIEGEILRRDSVQSSICKELGMAHKPISQSPQERGMGRLMMYLYATFNEDVSVKMLKQMNGLLWNKEENAFRNTGINVVSGRIDNPSIHFKALPAERVEREVNKFCNWFNASKNDMLMPPTVRAGIAHLYFVIIHPFKDGNGRISRSLAEKALSQKLSHPCLLALSETIEKHRKEYYQTLAKTNHTLDISEWLLFFSDMIIEAQESSIFKVKLIIEEAKLFQQFEKDLNDRQKKCIRRLFRAERKGGFVGGLSASNYVSITKASSASATRDLTQLVQLGILNRQGNNKTTRYFLKKFELSYT